MSAAAAPVASPASRAPLGVTPAFLAALAESGLLFLPLEMIVRVSSLQGSGGPLGTFAVFAPLFALGAAAATAGRRSRWFVPATVAVAVGVGLAQATWWGARTPAAEVAGALLGLALAVRVVTLALRDWRDPIEASFGWGAGVLLLEIVIAADGEWRTLLPLIVPVFFVASLASRAMSLRLAEGVETLAATSRQWAGLAAAASAVVGALVVGAAVVGGQGGTLERAGRIIPLLVYWILYGLTAVLAHVLRFLGWIGSLLGFHPHALQRLVQRIGRAPAAVHGGLQQATSGGAVQRILGLVLIAGVSALLVWLIVRQRRLWQERERRPDELVEPTPAPERPPTVVRRRGVRRRRELPEDTVRRWYAEALLALEARGVSRPPDRTPGEFLREAEAAFPSCAGSLAALTRAYEDVRYGSRVVDPGGLEVLEAHRAAVLTGVREGRPG